MQQFLTILAFYRPFVMWSLLVNIAIAIIFPFIIPAIATKLFLAVFVWYLVSETNARHKLKFYKRLGIHPIRLFTILFVVDISLTVGFLQVVKAYI
ncbi:MAG: hypothetical protein HKN00_14400 [Flavobacteriaceae bacterium]|nr:hypothetical protein [Bacteroidia bacterium]MBT8286544.1 hypothetical protein [Bacteroidia bacterium]NNF76373.1 hypothetical protein [Flavobacteriaceae bacterium]NNK72049.1 hypothetical protein [Flavobacteriaceae bacterium]